mgnify:CR=1 FL=1
MYQMFVDMVADGFAFLKSVVVDAVGWKLDPPTGRLVVVSCLDNLLKGAAGQAVQNFNVAFGYDERTGLL